MRKTDLHIVIIGLVVLMCASLFIPRMQSNAAASSTPTYPPECCACVVKWEARQGDFVTPGDPIITPQTAAILELLAEWEVGRPLTADELAIIALITDEASEIGYAQGGPAVLAAMRDEFCP